MNSILMTWWMAALVGLRRWGVGAWRRMRGQCRALDWRAAVGAALAAGMGLGAAGVQAQTALLSTNTPGSWTYQVPDGVFTIRVVLNGAGGGGGGPDSTSGGKGGSGAQIVAVMPVTPNQVLNGYVGAGGANGVNQGGCLSNAAGGSGAASGVTGGAGGKPGCNGYSGGGGGGGGSSSLAINGTVLQAGGGGGGGGESYNVSTGNGVSAGSSITYDSTCGSTFFSGQAGADHGPGDGGGGGGGGAGFTAGAYGTYGTDSTKSATGGGAGGSCYFTGGNAFATTPVISSSGGSAGGNSPASAGGNGSITITTYGNYWDGLNTSANNAVDGGSAPWDSTTSNWTISTGKANGPWAGGAVWANFAGAQGTVTVSGSQDIGGLNFITDGYTLSGGSLNLTQSTAGIQVASGSNATVSSAITGNYGFYKIGAGTLTLTGTNTYTGTTAVNDGILKLAATSAPVTPTSNAITVGNGAELAFGANDNWGIHSTTATAAVTINSGGKMSSNGFYNTLWNLTLNGGTVNANGGANAGFGSYGLAGTVTATGNSVINSSLTNGTVNIGGNGNLTTTFAIPSASDSLSIAAPLQNYNGSAANLTQTGSGKLTLTGANTYTGNTALAGTVVIGGSGTLGAGSYAGTISNNGLLQYSSAVNQTLSGVITGTGALIKDTSSSSTLMLTATNTYTGSTTVNAGTLNIAPPTDVSNAAGFLSKQFKVGNGANLTFTATNRLNIGYGGATTITLGDGSTMDVSGTDGNGGIPLVSPLTIASQSSASSTFKSTSQIGMNLNGQTLTLDTASGSTLTASAKLWNNSALVKSGTGTAILTASDSYSGTTTISAGTLQIGGSGSLASGAGNPYSANITNNGVFLYSSSANQTLSGSISGSGSVVKDTSTSSTLTLSGANTYSGGTGVNAGIVSVTNNLDNAFGTGTVTIGPSGSLLLATTGSNQPNWPNTVTGSGAINYSGSAYNQVFAVGDWSTYAGTVTLTGSGTGWCFCNAGSTAMTVVNNGNYFAILNGGDGNTPITVNIGALSGSGKIFSATGTATNTLSVGALNTDTTYSGPIMDSYSTGNKIALTKGGTGTLTLTGANTYSGATTVNGGTLAVGANSVLPAVSAVTVNAGAKLNVGTFAQTLNAALTVNTGGSLVLGSGSNLTLTSGSGNVTSNVAAIDSSSTGTITVGVGATLNLTANISAPNLSIVMAGGTLNLSGKTHSIGTLTQTVASTIDFSSAGQLSVANIGSTFTGTLTAAGWTGSNGHFFATAVNGSPARNTLGLAPLNQIKLGTSGDATLTYWAAGTPGELLAGAAAGSYTYWDTRADLAGINGGDGTWDGTLTNWTTSSGTPNGTWFAGGVATFQGTQGTVTIKDGYSASIGGLTFGTAGYTIAPNGTSGTGKLALASNATLTLPGSGTTTINAPITGTFSLTTAGTGTLVLSGSNTYSGGTTINAGTLTSATSNPNTAYGTGAITVGPSGTLALVTSGSVSSPTMPNAVTGSGNVTVAASPVYVSGDWSSFTGTLTTLATAGGIWLENTGSTGMVVVHSGQAIGLASHAGSSTPVTINIGSLSGSGNVFTASAGTATTTLSVGALNTSTSFAGAISDGSTASKVALTKVGSGSLTLTGSSTYTGGTKVSAGTLALGVNGALPAAGAVSVGGGVLDLGTFSQTLNGVLTVNGGTLKLGTGSNLTLTSGSGNVTSSIGAIDSSSTGTITVGTGATLNLTAAITAPNLKIVMAGGTLNLGSNLSHTIGSLTQNTASSTITFGTGSNLTVGTLGDLGNGLTLTASGWTAGSTHFYASAVASGAAKNQVGLAPLNQVQLGSNAATATYWSSTGNELLPMTTGVYTYWDTNATNTTVDGGSGNWDGSTLNWTPVGGTPRGTWAGGTETAYFNGSAGSVTLANSYAANIGGLNFGTYGYTINANAGGLLMLTKDATITINSSRGQAVAINAPIQGNFGITVTGGGTLQLSSPNNSYTGGTTLSNAGIDLVGPAIACSSSSTSTPLGKGTLSIGSNSGIWLGTDNQLGCPASAGTGVTGVVIQSGGGVNTTAAASTEMPALTLNGGSLMSLNSVSGTGITNGVYRMSGDVQVTADSAISAPNVNNVKAGGTTYNVLSGTKLTIGSTGYFGYGTGPGQADTGFILTGGGTMVFSGASNTATGPIQVTNGTLQVGDSGSTGDIASHASVSLGTSGTLSFKRSNAYTFATAIGGSGKLSQDGGGTTTLSGANTYTGTTSVNSGTLLVTGSTASTSAVTVAAGATLGGSGTVAGTVNVLGFLSPGLGAGTVGTLNTGALTLGNTGTLTLDLGTPGTAGGTANDYVNVTGNVNLGGNLVINKLTGFSTTGSYTLLSYSGTRTGTFASTNLSTIGYQGMIQYDDANKKVLLVAIPRLRVTQVSNGGTGTFSFVMTGLDTASVSLSTQTAGTGVTSATFNGTVGTAVKIDQTIPNGWPATPGSISCVDANGASTGNGSGALGTVSGVEVNLPGTKLVAGADITCTFTNTRNGIAGVVFNDGGAPSSGANTGTPNDGVQNGAEAGVGGLTVNLTNCAGTTYASTTTDGNGAYGLSIPTAQIGQAVCVQPVLAANTLATGANSAGTVLPNGSVTTVGGVGYTYTRASQQASFTAPASGTVTLNFGQVPASTLSPTTSARQAQPGVKAVHTHSFTAGTGGSLQVQLGAGTANPGTVTGWSEIAYLDPGCTGSVQQNATRLYPSGTPMTVVQGQVVCFVVQEQVPVQAGTGNSNAVPVTTALTFTNAAPSLSASYTATDTTTVSNSALQLTKEVRNVTQGVTTFGTNNQAKSGEVLEYRITYANTAPSPITSLVINDATPTYTSFVSAKTDTTPSGLTACTKVTPANVAPAPVVGCDVAQTAGGTGPLSWTFTGTLNGGGTGAVLFQVKVD